MYMYMYVENIDIENTILLVINWIKLISFQVRQTCIHKYAVPSSNTLLSGDPSSPGNSLI